MPNINYKPNIPFATNAPAQDSPNMKINTNAIETWINVDHIGFQNNQGGYHNLIHLVNQTNQALTPGQLFTKNVTVNSVTDNQLFYTTGGGGINQITGSSPTTNGYAFLGGVIMQWGLTTMSFFSTTLAYGFVPFSTPNLNFPTNCFNVQVSLLRNSGLVVESNRGFVTIFNVTANIPVIGPVTPPSKTGFYYVFTGSNAAAFTQFFWTAIGN